MVLISILTILLIIFYCENVSITKIEIDRVEILNSSYMEGIYNISELYVSKFNRTAYVLNVKMMLYIDIDENCEVELSLHHNRLNNNQYNKMPFGISRRSCCQLLEEHYRTVFMPLLKDVSNLPQLKEGDHVCPIKKVLISYN